MDTTEKYRAAYRLFSRLTPLEADCGRLCRARCCRGGENDGMILFPHEETLLQTAGFLTIQSRELRGNPCAFAVCGGHCIRALRPLSCRIFPLAPRFSGRKITVTDDPRARAICPLLEPELIKNIRPEFEAAVLAAFTILLDVPDMPEFLRSYSEMLDDYRKFLG